jgi:hypothetical protein
MVRCPYDGDRNTRMNEYVIAGRGITKLNIDFQDCSARLRPGDTARQTFDNSGRRCFVRTDRAGGKRIRMGCRTMPRIGR